MAKDPLVIFPIQVAPSEWRGYVLTQDEYFSLLTGMPSADARCEVSNYLEWRQTVGKHASGVGATDGATRNEAVGAAMVAIAPVGRNVHVAVVGGDGLADGGSEAGNDD